MWIGIAVHKDIVIGIELLNGLELLELAIREVEIVIGSNADNRWY